MEIKPTKTAGPYPPKMRTLRVDAEVMGWPPRRNVIIRVIARIARKLRIA